MKYTYRVPKERDTVHFTNFYTYGIHTFNTELYFMGCFFTLTYCTNIFTLYIIIVYYIWSPYVYYVVNKKENTKNQNLIRGIHLFILQKHYRALSICRKAKGQYSKMKYYRVYTWYL